MQPKPHGTDRARSRFLALLIMLVLLIPSVLIYTPTVAEDGEEPDTEDTDGDGLTDEEEEEIGTNYKMEDTDEDGISDYDEIHKWKTNPTRESTDGDRYDDGMEIFGHSPVGLGDYGGDMPGYVTWPGNSVFAAAYPDIEVEISDNISVAVRELKTEGHETTKTTTHEYSVETIDGSSLTVGTEQTHTFGDGGWQQAHNSDYDESLAKDYQFQLGEGQENYIQGHNLGVSYTTEEGPEKSFNPNDFNPFSGKISQDDLSLTTKEYRSGDYSIPISEDSAIWNKAKETLYDHSEKPVQFAWHIQNIIDSTSDLEFGASILLGEIPVAGTGFSALTYVKNDVLNYIKEKYKYENFYVHSHTLNNPGLLIYTGTLNTKVSTLWITSLSDELSESQFDLPFAYYQCVDESECPNFKEEISEAIIETGQKYLNYIATIGSGGAFRTQQTKGDLIFGSASYTNDIGKQTTNHVTNTIPAHGSGKESSYRTTETYSAWHQTTVKETEINTFSETYSFSNTTETTHAGELGFHFYLKNVGTDIAREINDLRFNIIIGDSNEGITYPNLDVSGFALSNLLVGSETRLWASKVPLNIEQVQAIDNGSSITIQVAYYSFGEDQLHYESALGKCVLFHIDDGIDDGDESFEKYLIATWGDETYLDVLSRLLPVELDDNYILKSIINKTIDEWSYWSVKLTEYTDTKSFVFAKAEPRTRIMMIYYQDSDKDHYTDRSEIRIGTDPRDSQEHPAPKLKAGIKYQKDDKNVTGNLIIENMGNYDAYGISVSLHSISKYNIITDGHIGGEGLIEPGENLTIEKDNITFRTEYNDIQDVIAYLRYSSPDESITSIITCWSKTNETDNLTYFSNMKIQSQDDYYYTDEHNISISFNSSNYSMYNTWQSDRNFKDMTLLHDVTDENVNAVAISKNGKYTAIATVNYVILYDNENKEKLWTSDSTGQDIATIAISDDGEYIVAGTSKQGSTSNKVYLFNKGSKTPYGDWPYTPEGGKRINSVDISSDGEYIVVGCRDNKVYYFDKDSIDPEETYTTSLDVTSVAISSNGRYIAAGSQDKNLYFYDTENSNNDWSEAFDNFIISVDISSNGDYIVAGSLSEEVKIFSKDEELKWDYSTNGSNRVAISSDGKYIVVGSSAGELFLYDIIDESILWNETNQGEIQSVAISSDGNKIIANSGDYYIYDNSGKLLWKNDIGSYHVSDISSNGRYIAISGDKNNYVFDFSYDTLTRKNTAVENATLHLAFQTRNGTILRHEENTTNLFVGNNSISTFWNPSDDSTKFTYGQNLKLISKLVDSQGFLIAEDITKMTIIDDRSNLFIYTDDILFSDDDPMYNKSIDVSVRIFNTGKTSASGFNIALYDGHPDLDGELIDRIEDSSLPANENATVNFTWDNITKGDHDIYVVLDEEGSINESIEGDNIAYRSIHVGYLPDLMIDAPNIIVSNLDPIENSILTISSILHNLGDIEADGFNVSLLVDGELNQTYTNLNLSSFSSIETSFTWNTTVGHHTIQIIIDSNGTDADYSNNNASISLYVRRKADIDPGEIHFSNPSPTCGETIEMSSAIQNNGDLDAADVRVRILIGDYIIEETVIDYIPSGQERVVWASWETYSGNHEIRFEVNNDGYVDESNTLNNYENKTITVQEPEDESPVVFAGEDVTVRVNESVTFSGYGYDPDGSIILYEWDLDEDGVFEWSSTEHGNTDYTYSEPGIYFAKFRVTDNEGTPAIDIRAIFVEGFTSTVNVAPNADAGENQEVFVNDTVIFNGKGFDSDGSIQKYEWDLDGDGLFEWSSSDHGATNHTYYSAGIRIAKFRVTDNSNETAMDVVVIVVRESILKKPIADAGDYQVVLVNDTVLLRGYGSDSDGSIMNYYWKILGNDTFNYTNTEHGITSISFVTCDDYIAVLTVTDDDGLQSLDMVMIRVIDEHQNSNKAPIANAGTNQIVYNNSKVLLRGYGSDTDGKIVSYEWGIDGIPDFEYYSNDHGVANHTFQDEGEYIAILTVTDNSGKKTSDMMLISVIEEVDTTNKAPVADAGPDRTVEVGDILLLSGYGRDEDGAVVSYEWEIIGDPNFEITSSEYGHANHTFTDEGEYVAILTVTDNSGRQTSDMALISVFEEIESINKPPVADAGPNQEVYVNDVVLLRGYATDEDGMIIAYEWDIDDDGTFETPNIYHGIEKVKFDTPGEYVVTLKVTDDATLSSLDKALITVREQAIITPIASAGFNQVVFVGEEVLFGGVSSNFDGDIVLYEWDFDGDGTFETNNPDIARASHVYNIPDTYIAELRVTDSGDATSSDYCIIHVKPMPETSNALPVAEIQNDVKVNVNQATTLNGLGSDPDGSIVKYEWDFDGDGIYEWNGTGSGVVQHTYTKAGVYYAKLRVTDDEGGTDTEVCEVTVIAPSDSSDDGPGFGSLLALTALCLVTVVWRRKRRLPE